MRAYRNLWAVLGLVAAMTSCYSSGFSGEMRMDGRVKRAISGVDTSSSDLTDRLVLSRMRLRHDKEWGPMHRWSTRLEFHMDEQEGPLFKQSVLDVAPLTESILLSEANVSYKMHRTIYRMGLIEAPNLTPAYERFTLGIGQQIGSILGRSGYYLGAEVSFREGPFGGTIGVWQNQVSGAQGYHNLQAFEALSTMRTPSALLGSISPQIDFNGTEVLKSLPSTSFATATTPYGIGGRVAYVPFLQKNRSLGLGVGYSYQILEQPIVLGVLYDPYVAGIAADTEPAVPATGYYRLGSFKDLSQMTIDCLRTYDGARMAASFSMQSMPIDQKAGILTNDLTGGAATASLSPYAFEDNGLSFAYYAEMGLLMKGEGYRIDRVKNAVTGIRLGAHKMGWEIGARYGVERTTNMLSLLNQIGMNDLTSSAYVDANGEGRYQLQGVQTDATGPYLLIVMDNSGYAPYITPLEESIDTAYGIFGTKDVTQSFKTLSRGGAVYLNFYLAENIVCKAQFECLWHQKRIYTRDNDYVQSINYQTDRNIQFRVESFF